MNGKRSKSEVELVKTAKELAIALHDGQLRKGDKGEAFINHPCRVASHVSGTVGMSAVCEAAAWLHDSIEDTGATSGSLMQIMLRNDQLLVADVTETISLVKDLTNVFTSSAYPYLPREVRKQCEAYRLSDICPDAQSIKACDICDNLATIESLPIKFAWKYLDEELVKIRHLNDANPKLIAQALEHWAIAYHSLKLLEAEKDGIAK